MTEDPVVTEWFSEEEGGRKDCPDAKVRGLDSVT